MLISSAIKRLFRIGNLLTFDLYLQSNLKVLIHLLIYHIVLCLEISTVKSNMYGSLGYISSIAFTLLFTIHFILVTDT